MVNAYANSKREEFMASLTKVTRAKRRNRDRKLLQKRQKESRKEQQKQVENLKEIFGR